MTRSTAKTKTIAILVGAGLALASCTAVATDDPYAGYPDSYYYDPGVTGSLELDDGFGWYGGYDHGWNHHEGWDHGHDHGFVHAGHFEGGHPGGGHFGGGHSGGGFGGGHGGGGGHGR
ncbi:MAG: hypothetical protein JWL84_3610 [Rhodospirillales bacterium]|nr:hypothetical protein [Rhodospirillales bacterium]